MTQPPPFDPRKHEKGMWRRFYSERKRRGKKQQEKCDQCGNFFDWDQLERKTILRGSMTATKRTCKRCKGGLTRYAKNPI
jgi:hypothetical protein